MAPARFITSLRSAKFKAAVVKDCRNFNYSAVEDRQVGLMGHYKHKYFIVALTKTLIVGRAIATITVVVLSTILVDCNYSLGSSERQDPHYIH